ncbi:hypothetical protein K438DRAFT_1710246 [Mycena galopus ATCC 62051]|nr:hypothetical protein K438DRAFT_1710246 [Mycena galopus ATCC 62051]
MSEPTVRDASDPFSPSSNEENPPDVILRSSDLVDFHTHKAVLSFASPVFRDMWSLPQPVGEMLKDGKVVVSLSEPSKTIEKFLVLCYPPSHFRSYGFRDLDGVDGAYEAAGKFQIEGGQKLLEQLLGEPSFLQNQPHRVFAIACHRGLEKLAKAAAMETLKMPRYVPDLTGSVPEFDFISARQLRQLEDFHFRCSQIIARLVEDLAGAADIMDYSHAWNSSNSWDYQPAARDYDAVWWDKEGHGTGCGAIVEGDDVAGPPWVVPAQWFRDHVERVAKTAADHPDVNAASKNLADISGPTMMALSDCPKCVRGTPGSLKHLARWVVQVKAEEAYKQLLAQFSFVG